MNAAERAIVHRLGDAWGRWLGDDDTEDDPDAFDEMVDLVGQLLERAGPPS